MKKIQEHKRYSNTLLLPFRTFNKHVFLAIKTKTSRLRLDVMCISRTESWHSHIIPKKNEYHYLHQHIHQGKFNVFPIRAPLLVICSTRQTPRPSNSSRICIMHIHIQYKQRTSKSTNAKPTTHLKKKTQQRKASSIFFFSKFIVQNWTIKKLDHVNAKWSTEVGAMGFTGKRD